MKNNNKKNNNGITLIALVITIIVLLILAGIAISMLSGENGILKQASSSKTMTEEKSELERVKLALTSALANGLGKIDLAEGSSQDNSLEKALNEEFKNDSKKPTYENGKIILSNRETYNVTTSGSLNLVSDYNEIKVPEKKEPKDTVIKVLNQDGSGGDSTYSGQTKTFKDVEINTTENNATYSGFVGMTGTFENCTINGRLILYEDCTFINCEFNITGDDYNIWTWGAGNITFINCNFFSDGKALFVYGGCDQNITIEDCVFVDNGGLEDLKAAIEIGNDYNRSYNLNIKNTTVIGYEINNKGINTGTTLWANKNSMGQDKLNVVVDGVDVY